MFLSQVSERGPRPARDFLCFFRCDSRVALRCLKGVSEGRESLAGGFRASEKGPGSFPEKRKAPGFSPKPGRRPEGFHSFRVSRVRGLTPGVLPLAGAFDAVGIRQTSRTLRPVAFAFFVFLCVKAGVSIPNNLQARYPFNIVRVACHQGCSVRECPLPQSPDFFRRMGNDGLR